MLAAPVWFSDENEDASNRDQQQPNQQMDVRLYVHGFICLPAW